MSGSIGAFNAYREATSPPYSVVGTPEYKRSLEESKKRDEAYRARRLIPGMTDEQIGIVKTILGDSLVKNVKRFASFPQITQFKTTFGKIHFLDTEVVGVSDVVLRRMASVKMAAAKELCVNKRTGPRFSVERGHNKVKEQKYYVRFDDASVATGHRRQR